MPLTEKISFKARVQWGGRIQVPRFIRWQFKLEPVQMLRVSIGSKPVGIWQEWECFYAKMGKDGRILIPKLTQALIQERAQVRGLEGYVLEFTVEPV